MIEIQIPLPLYQALARYGDPDKIIQEALQKELKK
jgi:hypothetical protein